MGRARRPGEVRDTIRNYLREHGEAGLSELEDEVRDRFGQVSPSSVRSSLNLLVGDLFERTARGRYKLRANQ